MSCIYYGDRPELTYNKREHVIPASLGCTTMLPKGWVSDQANEFFSPMEDDFVHRSVMVSIERAMFGPGQRGSLLPQKAAQSDVSVGIDTEGHEVLTYLMLGKPYIIDCFCRTPKLYHIHFSPKHETPGTEFISALKKFTADTRYVKIHAREIHPDNVLIGFHNRKYYIAYNPDSEGKFDINREIKAFLVLSHSMDTSKQQKKEGHVEISLQQEDSHESSRVCAKIMLNTAAYLYGQEFVMRPEFNLVREWILEGKHEDIFFRLPYIDENTTLKKISPPDAHWCQFGIIEHKFVGVVCFYGTWERVLPLAEFDEIPIHYTDGFICDWKNRTDYKLIDYISKLGNQKN